MNSLDILYAGTRSRIGNSQSPTMQLHYSSMLPQGLWKLLEAAQGTARGGCRVGLIPPIQAITVCPWSSDPFNVVTYFIKWVTTSWTYSITFNTFHKVSCFIRLDKPSWVQNITFNFFKFKISSYHGPFQP